MKYTTPFKVINGDFYDNNFMPLEISCFDYVFEEGAKDTSLDIPKLLLQGINILRVIIDDSYLADNNGRLKNTISGLDKLMDDTYQFGLYVILVPITKGRATEFSGDVFTRQQRYFGMLFTHKNNISDKYLYEYENLVAIEILIDVDGFSDDEYDLYCGRVMMEVFIDHYFMHRVLKIFSRERGEPTPKQLATLNKYHIHVVNSVNFTQKDNLKLQCETFNQGIPQSQITAGIRESGKEKWLPVAVNDSMSVFVHPHANGGAEGWLTFAANNSVDLRIQLPYPVKKAIYRPSLIQETPLRIDNNIIELTLPEPRYGTIEINYNLKDIPAYTIHILGDSIIPDPGAENHSDDIHYIYPGCHTKRDLKNIDNSLLFFMPGLHDIEDQKLELFSDKQYYLSRGCVLRAGVITEEVENTVLFGQGILDGSTSPRDVGENKGSRMGEKWIDDAGREGFVCFYKGKNITFDGPVIFNSNYWNIVISGTYDCAIKNHKAITWLQNTDGIQPRSCNNLLIENCFLKCNDDAIAIKTRRTLNMESRNLVFKNLVIWQDRVASPLEIGHTSQGDILENITFKEIFIIHKGPGIHAYIIDHSTVRNVIYENIYSEGVAGTFDFSFNIAPSYYTTDEERGKIETVHIKNFYSEHEPLGVQIAGFDNEHTVRDVTFENINYFFRHPNKQFKASSIEQLYFTYKQNYNNVKLVTDKNTVNYLG